MRKRILRTPLAYISRCYRCNTLIAMMPLADDPRALRIPVALSRVQAVGKLFWDRHLYRRHGHEPREKLDTDI